MLPTSMIPPAMTVNHSASNAPSPWRSRRKTRSDRELKREAVIHAAARAFNEHGYHNTSLDDIAAALEVTKPTIYYYFPDKEELFAQMGLRRLAEMHGAIHVTSKI